MCISASSYNQTCRKGNYSCQTITQNTVCNLSNNKCSCATNYIWVNNKCAICPTGWIYKRGSCFFPSNSDKITNPESLTATVITNNCDNKVSARLAVLYNSDIPITFLSGSAIQLDYWFDFYRSTPSGTIYKSKNGNSSSIYNSNYWDSAWTVDQCAKWKVATNLFHSDICTHSHYLLCEIVL